MTVTWSPLGARETESGADSGAVYEMEARAKASSVGRAGSRWGSEMRRLVLLLALLVPVSAAAVPAPGQPSASREPSLEVEIVSVDLAGRQANLTRTPGTTPRRPSRGTAASRS